MHRYYNADAVLKNRSRSYGLGASTYEDGEKLWEYSRNRLGVNKSNAQSLEFVAELGSDVVQNSIPFGTFKNKVFPRTYKTYSIDQNPEPTTQSLRPDLAPEEFAQFQPVQHLLPQALQTKVIDSAVEGGGSLIRLGPAFRWKTSDVLPQKYQTPYQSLNHTSNSIATVAASQMNHRLNHDIINTPMEKYYNPDKRQKINREKKEEEEEEDDYPILTSKGEEGEEDKPLMAPTEEPHTEDLSRTPNIPKTPQVPKVTIDDDIYATPQSRLDFGSPDNDDDDDDDDGDTNMPPLPATPIDFTYEQRAPLSDILKNISDEPVKSVKAADLFKYKPKAGEDIKSVETRVKNMNDHVYPSPVKKTNNIELATQMRTVKRMFKTHNEYLQAIRKFVRTYRLRQTHSGKYKFSKSVVEYSRQLNSSKPLNELRTLFSWRDIPLIQDKRKSFDDFVEYMDPYTDALNILLKYNDTPDNNLKQKNKLTHDFKRATVGLIKWEN